MSVEERRKYENLKSRQEGIEQGKEEQKIEDARNVALSMLSDNVPDEFILKHVDITQEQLDELKVSLKSK